MNTQDKDTILGHIHHIQSRCKIINIIAQNPANDELLCVLLEDNFSDIQSLIAEYCTNGWSPNPGEATHHEVNRIPPGPEFNIRKG